MRLTIQPTAYSALATAFLWSWGVAPGAHAQDKPSATAANPTTATAGGHRLPPTPRAPAG